MSEAQKALQEPAWREGGAREAREIDFVGLDEERREAAELASFRASLQEPSRDDELNLSDLDGRASAGGNANLILVPMYFVLLGVLFVAACWQVIEPLGLSRTNKQALWMLGFLVYAVAFVVVRAWLRRYRSRAIRPAAFVTKFRLVIDATALRLSWNASPTRTTELVFALDEIAQLEGKRRLTLVRKSGERVPLPCSLPLEGGFRFATHELAQRCNEILGEVRMLDGYRGT